MRTKLVLLSIPLALFFVVFPPTSYDLPQTPTLADVRYEVFNDLRYGSHTRNTFDLYHTGASEPAPLIIYAHGGGFVGGDKDDINAPEHRVILHRLLQNGISVASMNYPLLDEMRVDQIMESSSRIIQHIRYNADELNVDSAKIGMYGSSAGGGIALHIGVNDDMADPDNPNPAYRESTKIQAVGHMRSQSTYDIKQWPVILIGIDIDMLPPRALNLYHVSSPEQYDTEQTIKQRRLADMPMYFDETDPPIFLENYGNYFLSYGDITHHPQHAIHLKSVCEKQQLECTLNTIYTLPLDRTDMAEFFIEHLK